MAPGSWPPSRTGRTSRPATSTRSGSSTAVARWPQWFPAHLVSLYASTLPLLYAGDLPTTPQAQAIKAWADQGGDLSIFIGASSFTDVLSRLR